MDRTTSGGRAQHPPESFNAIDSSTLPRRQTLLAVLREHFAVAANSSCRLREHFAAAANSSCKLREHFAVAANSCCRVARTLCRGGKLFLQVARALCRGGKLMLQGCKSTLPRRQTCVTVLIRHLSWMTKE